LKTLFPPLLKALKNYASSGRELKAIVGFDGYVDKIQKVLKSKTEKQSVYYDSITEIGNYLTTLSGTNGQIEIRNLEYKLAGNAPIMANALGALGIKNTCIGTMGYPDLHNVFEEMHANCDVISIAEPAQTNVMQFGDGKLIFSEVSTFEQLSWTYVSAIAGMENLTRCIYESQLVSFVNWANINYSTDIWQGILEDIIIKLSPTISEKEMSIFFRSTKNNPEDGGNGMRHKNFFFDLGNASERSKEEFRTAFSVISRYRPYGKTTLGINEKVARIIYQLFDGVEQETVDLQAIGRFIFDKMTVHQVLIYADERAVVATQKQIFEVTGRMISEQRAFSGASDNLNAGFCLGLVLDLSVEQTMLLGMANVGSYITNGVSPETSELISYLEAWSTEI
jgi:hypothetical protein